MRFWKYKRVLPQGEGGNKPSLSDVNALKLALQQIDTCPSRIPTGYTYFGQFINHDLSFMDITDIAPEGHADLDHEKLIQRRKAVLDLESIYGGGIEDSHVPYDGETGKFLLGEPFKHGIPRDFHRQPNHIAQIADPRNDVNMIIAQLQVLFMNFHNRVVDHFIRHGEQGAENLFNLARTEVIRNYVDLVLHDYVKRLVPDSVYDTVIVRKQVVLGTVDQESPVLALEFAIAAFRLHSMVRQSYPIRPGKGLMLDEILQFTGKYTQAHPGQKNCH